MIGTLNEKSLHADLKQWYANPGDRIETRVDGFIVDILRDDQIIEVQTGNFSCIRKKLLTLIQRHRVKLVYPVTQERWIIKLTGSGGKSTVRRKSPLRRGPEQVFLELVSFPELLRSPNFCCEIVLLQEEEMRRHLKAGVWNRRRRMGERRMLKVLGYHLLSSPFDLWSLIPDGLPDPFETSHLAEAFRKPRWFAQKAAYCLRKSGAASAIGRTRNAIVYSRWPQSPGDSPS